ncbi:MAG: hypothetical protein GXO75_19835 [Calditrichaeota bacterium]|nr:hypothetical protein [Calditrichota bacterium]
MTVQTKTTVIILTTLLIGFVLGFLFGNLQHRAQQYKRFSRFREHRGFLDLNERIIHPSPEQKKVVAKILEKYHKKFLQLNRRNFQSISTLLDSMYTELKPHLTKEQIQRLEKRRKMLKRRKEFMPPGERPMHHPPFGGPFGRERVPEHEPQNKME